MVGMVDSNWCPVSTT
jgi:hypothetical protein